MKTEEKMLGALLMVAIFAVAIGGSYFQGVDRGKEIMEEAQGSIGWDNTLEVCHLSAKTGQTDCQYVKNIVTSTGLNHTRDLLGGFFNSSGDGPTGTNATWRYLQLTTATGTPTGNEETCPATVITAAGLAITDSPNATSSKFGAGNYSVVKTFTAGSITTQAVGSVCLFNQTVGGKIMALAKLSSVVNMESNDQLTVNYSVAMKNS